MGRSSGRGGIYEEARANADVGKGQEPMLGSGHIPHHLGNFLKHLWGKVTKKSICTGVYTVPQHPPSCQILKATSRFSFTILHPTHF